MRSDDFLDDADDDDRDRFSTRSLFASGWFRALLVLGVLAITLAVAVPYVLRWMHPAPDRTDRQVARRADVRQAVAPTPVPAPVAPVASPQAPGPHAAVAPPTVPAPPAAATPAAASSEASAPVTERIVPAPVPPDREAPAVRPSTAATGLPTAEPATRPTTPRGALAESPTPKATVAATTKGGNFWVQVGAFLRERNAEALVRSIREDTHLPAQLTRRARPETAAAPARHEVFVTDAQVSAVNAVLRGRGSAQAVQGGVTVQPPLELKDAVALSRRLSGEGMSVKIRRVGGEGAAEAGTAYVVRVGGYTTRAQAEGVRRALSGKGVRGFIVEEPAR